MNVAAPLGDLNVAKNSDTDIFGGEAGVVKALSTLRQSAIKAEDKDVLRNLFLSYAGESDEAKRTLVKNQIVEIIGKNPQLSSLIVVQTESEESVSPEPPSTPNVQLGQSRPTPNFATPNVAKVDIPAQEIPAPQVTETKAEEVIETMVPVETAPAPTPAPTTSPVVTPPAPTPTGATDVRARIDTIKHDINSRVGNPVNVINADEAIGREYMSALLDAMKKSSTGGGAESLPRLETAYKATLDLIIAKNLGQKTNSSTEQKFEAKETEVVAEPVTIEPAPQIVEPTPPTPEPPVIEPEETPVVQQSEGLYHRPSDEIEAEINVPKTQPTSLASKLFGSSRTNKPEENTKTTTLDAVVPNVRKVEVNTNIESRTVTPSASLSEKLQPLQNASATLPEKMAAIKSAASKREEEAKKPITDLKSPEVEAGLKQLLSEWVLFRKSGFLGTGPNGINHPLYKKLAEMPMAAVVSGRFEGVNPDIKRHLSDYMTGWRYEQGVMHEMGETFEHYLRRVIRQVLERQRTQATKKS